MTQAERRVFLIRYLLAERQETAEIPMAAEKQRLLLRGLMIMNLRCDDRFVEDEGWHRAAERYANLLHTHRGGRTLYLELGVGFNTPGIIKYPFWQRVAQDPNAVYVCINAQEAVCPQDIAPRALCIRTDIAACLETLCG